MIQRDLCVNVHKQYGGFGTCSYAFHRIGAVFLRNEWDFRHLLHLYAFHRIGAVFLLNEGDFRNFIAFICIS